MNDKQLYAQILGIRAPWKVSNVSLGLADGKVEVYVTALPAAFVCPECGRPCPGYDRRERRWRHLDTCQYQTFLVGDIPRVECPEHGVKQVQVPWAEPGSRLTSLFESLVIDWLKEASQSAVAKRMSLSWDQVDGVMARAVERGLIRRQRKLPARIGVDETSFQKRHEYVTIVCDLEGDGGVLHVADGHDRAALECFYEQFSEEERSAVDVVAMDMGRAYPAATRAFIPEAHRKIAFDRFHVVKLMNDAVDTVRRGENRELRSQGDKRLVGSRHYWLQGPLGMSEARWERFEKLRESALKTARAYAIKDLADSLWAGSDDEAIREQWARWYAWAIRSRLEPMKRVAKTVKANLDGIIVAIKNHVTNARLEAVNSLIQKLKKRAHGYRNRQRFRNAIYFHLGKLDLYPEGAAG
ncbi:MAG: ISL3 family transposase [Rhodobacteraceae bacterium]|nr:ISL3 family transposase [Paracoccaceae bacterium]